MKQRNNGFTLVEILIFVTLISLIFITVSYTITLSLKNTKINENKILATHYAEELKEWLRGEKEIDWSYNFILKSGTFCFKDEPITAWGSNNPCNVSDKINNIFKREVILTPNPPSNTQSQVQITVEWQEDNNTHTIPINTVFSIWE